MDKNNRWKGPLTALAAFAAVALLALWWRHGRDDGQPEATPAATPTPVGGVTKPTPNPTEPYVQLAEYRAGNDFDPGTVRVFIANPGPAPVTVKRVLLDGFPLPVRGLAGAEAESENIPMGETHGPAADDAGEIPARRSGVAPIEPPPVPQSSHPANVEHMESSPAGATVAEASAQAPSTGRWGEHWAVWSKISSATIPSGGVVEFSAKPRHFIKRHVNLEFGLDDGSHLAASVPPAPPTLRVESVAFSDNRSTMYVYVRNVGPVPLTWRGVALVERPDARPDWQSDITLAPAQYGLATLPLADASLGDFLTVRVDYGEEQKAIERVRVLTGFPLAAEWGGGNPALGIDPTAYTADFRKPEAAAAVAAESFRATQSAMIFECAMHTYAARQDLSAREIMRRYDLLCLSAPNVPASIHLCRVRPEVGYSLFAGTADILRFNPNIPNGLSKKGTDGSPESAVASLCWYGYEAARPRPIHTLADTGAFDQRGAPASPEEFRNRTYADIGSGTRGLLYRLSGQPGPGLREEILRVNREINHLRPLLAMACPVDWASWMTSPGKTTPTPSTENGKIGDKNILTGVEQSAKRKLLGSLLSGRDALIVVVVRPVPGSGESASGVVSLRLPAWFRSGTLTRIVNGEEVEWSYQASSVTDESFEGGNSAVELNTDQRASDEEPRVDQAGSVLNFSVPADCYAGAFLLRNALP